MIHNINVSQKDRKPIKEFLLDWEGAAEKAEHQPWQLQLAVARCIVAAFNADAKELE